MSEFDVTFVGHVCRDEIARYGEPPYFAPGSAVLCGALAAVRVGMKVAVVTRLAAADDGALLGPMRELGIRTFARHVPETTFMRVLHPTPDVDVREMYQTHSAGPFALEDVPELDTRFLHLAGITDQEFTLELMRGLRAKGYSLSTDMQSFVRQVDRATTRVSFADVPHKQAIVALMDRVKLDNVEAQLLTGEADMAAAAAAVERWGCPEVVITQSRGVTARVRGETHFAPFTNRNMSGRTGRGDTTFAGYMAWRLEHGPAEALAFAAALVSIKMETPGPFAGSRADVLARMARAQPTSGPAPAPRR